MEAAAESGRTPRVTVGMPAYNAEPWVGAAIDAILAQTFSDFELIISDNASTDGTAAICEAYADRDARIRFVRQERNRGAVYNYNRVLSEAAAAAPYFKWASANDLCHPEFLATCVECLDTDPQVVLAYPASLLFDDRPDDGEPYDDDLGLDVGDPCLRFIRFVDRVGLNNLMNGLMRREALLAGPPDRCFRGSDYIVMAALTLRGRFRRIPERLFYRRMDAATSTRHKSRRAVSEHYDPTGKRRMLFQFWRRRLEYFRAVVTGPIPLRSKFRLCLHLVRSTFGVRTRLWEDVVDSLRGLVAGAPRGHG